MEDRWTAVAEITAIVLVLAARSSGLLPLPVWPLLLAIAAGFHGAAAGWSLPRDWRTTPAVLRAALIACVVGVGYQFFTIFVESPLLEWAFQEAETPPPVDGLVGNLGGLAGFLGLVTIFSVGEELAFRGYVLARFEVVLGGSRLATGLALAASSAAFGAMHTWQNLPAAVGTTMAGFVFGAAFLWAGRDVRVPALVHLASNVTAVVLAFLGLFVS